MTGLVDCQALGVTGLLACEWSKAGLCVCLSEGVTGLVDCKALGVTGLKVVVGALASCTSTPPILSWLPWLERQRRCPPSRVLWPPPMQRVLRAAL